jgi:hypothetical protein
MPTQKVWFIDLKPAFGGHRFYEPDAQEPDPDSDDTLLFLSRW